MRTNISKFTTVYGDRQYPNDTEMFPSSSSVFCYLNDYADEFKLRDHIKLQSEVVSVEPVGNGTYRFNMYIKQIMHFNPI